MKLTLDIETYSECNLKTAGLAAYSEHPSTDINCACWSFDDGPVSAWIPSADEAFAKELATLFEIDGGIHYGSFVPAVLIRYIEEGGELHAWNAAFERCVLGGTAGKRYNFPQIKIPQTRCSMANARVHGLPGALEDAGNAINCPIKKRLAGLNAMRYLCKPRKDGTRPTIVEERKRFLELIPYCADDVRAERAIDAIVPAMVSDEQEIYEIDQEMNDRGVLVDLHSIDNMEVLIQKYKKILKERCLKVTKISPSNPGMLAHWIRTNGYPALENLQADTVRRTVMKPEVPDNCKEILRIYSTYNMKSVEKYKAMRQAAMKDGRIRHMFLFYGAGTGRWSSLIVQLQNLFRPVIDDPDNAVAAAEAWDLDWIRALYPDVDPMKVIASCIRSMLIAGPGNQLIFPDYSGVEGRWNAWMFGESWKIKVFNDADAGRGPDSYTSVIAQCYNMSAVDLAGEVKRKVAYAVFLRQLGKVLDLSMGYEGGVGAFVKMAGTYRIDLKDMAAKVQLPPAILEEAVQNLAYAEEQGRVHGLPENIWLACEGLKLLWRKAHPKIVWGWKELKNAAHDAVANPGQCFNAAGGRVMFKTARDWLVMRLPSGRLIWYYKPELKLDTLYYYGIDTTTRMWGRTSTYGGKICENETQAGCRDLLTAAKRRLRAAGYPLIGSVHDQPLMEAPVGFGSEEEVTELMCAIPAWAPGFPLAIEYHAARRFRK